MDQSQAVVDTRIEPARKYFVPVFSRVGKCVAPSHNHLAALGQGLTLVHFSDGRDHCLWDALGAFWVSVTETAQVEPKSGRVVVAYVTASCADADAAPGGCQVDAMPVSIGHSPQNPIRPSAPSAPHIDETGHQGVPLDHTSAQPEPVFHY